MPCWCCQGVWTTLHAFPMFEHTIFWECGIAIQVFALKCSQNLFCSLKFFSCMWGASSVGAESQAKSHAFVNSLAKMPLTNPG